MSGHSSRTRSTLAFPPAVEETLRRVEHWRATRERRTRMPEELWASAVALAHVHGVWFVSRALRVNYEGLKRRLASAPARSVAGFVEVAPSALGIAGPGATTVVELSSGDGARLTVRLEGHGALDVAALVAAFWRRDR